MVDIFVHKKAGDGIFKSLSTLQNFSGDLNDDIEGIKEILTIKACGEMNSAIGNITSLSNANHLLKNILDSTRGILPILEGIVGIQNGMDEETSECFDAVKSAFENQVSSFMGRSATRRRLLMLSGVNNGILENYTDAAAEVLSVASNNLTDLLSNTTNSDDPFNINYIESPVRDISFINDTSLFPILNYTMDNIQELTSGTFLSLHPSSVLSDIRNMASNIDLRNLNLNSTRAFLDFVNTSLNKTAILQDLEALGLTECVSKTNKLLSTQSNLLNGDSLNTLQNEISSFYESYETFMNGSFLPPSLKGKEEDMLCVSSIRSFLTMINNLTLLTTFVATDDYARNVISLKDNFQLLLPPNEIDDLGNCNWPLKNSIWKIPNNGMIQCNNFTEISSGNVLDIFDDAQEEILKDLQRTVADINEGIISTDNLLSDCAINSIMDTTSACGNHTNAVLSDLLNLLITTLSSINSIHLSSILPLKTSLSKALYHNLSFSKYQLAEDFDKMNRNMTNLVSYLEKARILLKNINLTMAGNAVKLVPKLYSSLDDFKLITLGTKELNNLIMFSTFTNGSGEKLFPDGLVESDISDLLSGMVSGISKELATIDTELSTITANLGNVVNQLGSNLNAYLLSGNTGKTFYR